jgi:anaerobic magnesium-protoporphyrin IX monomethyl ester cyclase
VFRSNNNNPLKSDNKVQSRVIKTKKRELIEDLNYVPLPARELFENEAYIDYYRRKGLAPTTSIMTSRGCPFSCDFCSRPVFGNEFRERSASSIADEVEDILSLGYEKVFFQDDCFTLTKKRVIDFCDEINQRRLEFKWDCLSRVDSMDKELADKMKASGCEKIFFGLESGDDNILKIMKKSANTEQARRAVKIGSSSGIKTGGFFILGYPGETNDTILSTINFALSLPLDYLSFSIPYPIPGTGLYEKTNNRLSKEKQEPKHRHLIDHELIYESDFSEEKLRFAIFKGTAQFYIRKKLGLVAPLIEIPFNRATNIIFKNMR